jgi:TDG/mug DNA glycosylase family protein
LQIDDYWLRVDAVKARTSTRVSARLRDRVGPNLRVLFVGINPGLRSAALGHHFAGYSNRFWKLLFEAGLVPRPVTWTDDDEMPRWGYGITNLVARATAGVGDLSQLELRAGRRALVAKVHRLDPEIVGLIGITVYRAVFGVSGAVQTGLADARLGGARVFVLPNPSGRNAHYSYQEMVTEYAQLRALLDGVSRANRSPSNAAST